MLESLATPKAVIAVGATMILVLLVLIQIVNVNSPKPTRRVRR